MWSRTYGGTDWDFAYSLAATSDGGYTIGGYTGDIDFWFGNHDFWLVKTDVLGNMEWNRTYGGSGNDRAYSLVVTSDGGYAIASATSYEAGDYDFLLVKTDEFGVVPEYSSWLVPALVLTATAFIVINKKKLLHKR
jgi:hypothetical protein